MPQEFFPHLHGQADAPRPRLKGLSPTDDIRGGIERRLNILQEAGILELKVIETPEVQ